MGLLAKCFGNIYRHFTVLTEKTMRIKVQLHKNFQHILLGSSEKIWAYLISAPFFLIDFYLVESIVSFAKKYFHNIEMVTIPPQWPFQMI